MTQIPDDGEIRNLIASGQLPQAQARIAYRQMLALEMLAKLLMSGPLSASVAAPLPPGAPGWRAAHPLRGSSEV